MEKPVKFLKALLGDLGIKDAEFIRLAGISQKTVWNWKNEDLPRGAIPKISEVLSVPEDVLRAAEHGEPIPPEYRDAKAWALRRAGGRSITISASTYSAIEAIAASDKLSVSEVVERIVGAELLRVQRKETPASVPASQVKNRRATA